MFNLVIQWDMNQFNEVVRNQMTVDKNLNLNVI